MGALIDEIEPSFSLYSSPNTWKRFKPKSLISYSQKQYRAPFREITLFMLRSWA